MFDCLIIDEAHRLRNINTAQSQAIFKLGKVAKRRFALTGTPTINHASDIGGILMFLYPKKYPSYWQFCERYFQVNDSPHHVGQEVGWPKSARIKEMQELVGILSVQRKRSEVMPWLPKKQFKSLSCSMSGKQLKLYNEMKEFFTATDDFHISEADLNNYEESPTLDAMNPIVQLMRLRQLSLDPRLVGFDVVGAKTKTLLDYLENRREPIVVMSMFTSYLKMIAEDIKKLKLRVGFVHGQMTSNQKDQAVKDFQAGKLDVLLCNIISAGVGLTMDKSNAVIFIDRAWTPAENEQAEDRICPTSEERNHAHLVVEITCEDSVDARISKILKKKKSLVQYINEGGREAIRNLISG
jgi:SNF2 family DNA or RNA helicase